MKFLMKKKKEIFEHWKTKKSFHSELEVDLLEVLKKFPLEYFEHWNVFIL